MKKSGDPVTPSPAASSTTGSPASLNHRKDEAMCGVTEAFCICLLPPDHDGPHACDPKSCGGEWTFDDEGRFVMVALPGLPWLFGDDDEMLEMDE